MRYLQFLTAHARILAFGFLCAFFSCFGQTFLVALFGAELRAAFDLSHGGYGLTYSAATLAGALALVWTGRQIDRIDLRLYAALVCAGLALSCLFMALVPSLLLLYAAMFALRLTGQGLMSHTALTTMGRHFAANRGKAVSFASLGYPASQAIMPILAVTLIGAVGWRGTWALFAAIPMVLIPLLIWLLRAGPRGETDERAAPAGGTGAASPSGATAAPRDWSRAEMLRDPAFYLLTPAALAPPFIMTGLFFHQIHLIESKGWSLAWFASSFIGFAAVTVATLLLAGFIVDRFSATRIMPFYLIPQICALLVLAGFDHHLAALGFMVLAGVTTGASRAATGTVWAELYGVAHLGAIRALVQALGVGGTAISPFLFGALFDAGLSVEGLALGCAALAAAVSLMAAFAVRGRMHRAATAG